VYRKAKNKPVCMGHNSSVSIPLRIQASYLAIKSLGTTFKKNAVTNNKTALALILIAAGKHSRCKLIKSLLQGQKGPISVMRFIYSPAVTLHQRATSFPQAANTDLIPCCRRQEKAEKLGTGRPRTCLHTIASFPVVRQCARSYS
jgi:hypothetical protein